MHANVLGMTSKGFEKLNYHNMKNLIKRIAAKIRRKPLLVIPVVSGSKLCPDCEGEMAQYDCPIETTIFKIPFTDIEILARNWVGKEYYCPDCVRDKEQERQHEAYYYGAQEGFNKGYDAAMREHGVYYR